MFFDKIIDTKRKKIGEVFPNLELLLHGGVNFQPYSDKIEHSIGRKIDMLEIYPASEGFIAYQDNINERGLLLLLNQNIFFEFIPTREVFSSNPTRITIEDVELDEDYAIILNSKCWAMGLFIRRYCEICIFKSL